MKIKKLKLNLTEETKKHLGEISLLTGISIDGIITGILWDYILQEYDKKKERKHGKQKISYGNCS